MCCNRRKSLGVLCNCYFLFSFRKASRLRLQKSSHPSYCEGSWIAEMVLILTLNILSYKKNTSTYTEAFNRTSSFHCKTDSEMIRTKHKVSELIFFFHCMKTKAWIMLRSSNHSQCCSTSDTEYLPAWPYFPLVIMKSQVKAQCLLPRYCYRSGIGGGVLLEMTFSLRIKSDHSATDMYDRICNW